MLGSEGVQDGVKALLSSYSVKPPKPAPTVTVDYWVVLGAPGKTAPIPENLQGVSAALAQLLKTDGQMEFTLKEKLTVTSIGGEPRPRRRPQHARGADDVDC